MINTAALWFQKITRQIDRFNDRFTSYRLVLYFLLLLLGLGEAASLLHKVPFAWYSLLLSAAWLTLVCRVVNRSAAKFMHIVPNSESDLISALILTLILSPAANGHDYIVLAAAGVVAMVSKYVLVLYKSHVFNPAAAGAYAAGLIFHQYPSWWVGTSFIAPLVILGAVFILRKTKRYLMVATFGAVYVIYLVIVSHARLSGDLIKIELLSTQLLFFSTIMLIEPLTSPTLEKFYLPYAALVGILYSVTRLRVSPEAALLIGNLFTLIVSPNRRYQMAFKQKIQEAEGIYSYIFAKPPGLQFAAGQYMEWTLNEPKSDSRGNRRYLTIASSPTEPDIMVAVKHPTPASAFKQRLNGLKPGEPILGAHLAGQFTLPEKPTDKLAFLAGGVGITPFRSMIRYLTDKGQNTDAVLIYSVTKKEEAAFSNVFSQARSRGIKPYLLAGEKISPEKIRSFMPDFLDRKIYVSGPYGFVKAAEEALLNLGAKPGNIVTDYFPGYGG